MPFMSTVEQLDAQITATEAELLKLKRRRKAATWTHHLPHEILAEIFCLLQHNPRLPFTYCTCYDHEWTSVLDTCDHFRAVAVQAPQLWSTVDLQAQDEGSDDSWTCGLKALAAFR
jgi:hypothetical protein